MTIKELFDKVAKFKPHAYTEPEMISWLTRIEGRIYADIILTHDNPENITFEGYTDLTDKEQTNLIVRQPHDDLYLYYLMAQIDLHNMEYDKYNQSAGLFHDAYNDFERFWNTNRRPVQKILFFPY